MRNVKVMRIMSSMSFMQSRKNMRTTSFMRSMFHHCLVACAYPPSFSQALTTARYVIVPTIWALLGLCRQRDKYASNIGITVIKTVAETTDHKTWLLEAYEFTQVAVWNPTLSLVLSVFAFLWFSFGAFMQCVLFATLLLATLRFAILLKGPIDLHQWFAHECVHCKHSIW